MTRFLLVSLFCIIAACRTCPDTPDTLSSLQKIPDSLAGMPLSELRENYRARLFVKLRQTVYRASLNSLINSSDRAASISAAPGASTEAWRGSYPPSR